MKKKETMSAFLGEGSEFEGKLRFQGIVRIDGHFKGEILDGTSLFIGDKALIEGDIHAVRVVLTGELRGGIVAQEDVIVQPPGKVYGSIQARKATIAEGAVFVGKCRITPPKTAEERAAKVLKDLAPREKEKPKSADAKPEKDASPEPQAGAAATGPGKEKSTEHFIKVCCEISAEGLVQAHTFYQAYQKWCASKGTPPDSTTQFGKILTDRFVRVNRRGKRYYKGLRLRPEYGKS